MVSKRLRKGYLSNLDSWDKNLIRSKARVKQYRNDKNYVEEEEIEHFPV